MDDKIRSSGAETNDTEDSPQKQSRRRRTPSADDVKSKRRSHSSSRSRSPSRDRSSRRRRSRSRGHHSPDRRYGRFNRGGYPRDRRRRSPSRSPGFRGRNRNARRSRSTSYDRYRNRRKSSQSRERSSSHGRGAPPPPAPYQADYQSAHFPPEYQVTQPAYPNPPQFGNYDYVAMMQQNPTSFPAYPPPNQDYIWSAQVPPPPIISMPAPNVPAPALEPAAPALPAATEDDDEKQKRQAAIAAEKKIQRDTIRKQRDDYTRRSTALKRELKTLKEQREELIGSNGPPSPTTHGFIKENDRLQNQIEHKIGTFENVIEMLNGILSADKSDTESPKKQKPAPKEEAESDDSSPERLKTKALESRKRKDSDKNRKEEKSSKVAAAPSNDQVNYTFFDPEQHWCKACSAFPKTAKEYLIHLHSEEHKANVKSPEIPWHDNLVKDDMPTYQNAPVKRTPIRGLQFFVPSTAWYCKLCSIWIGDLHCASTHLKSRTHAREYEKFIVKNAAFESDWLEERQKAFDLNRNTDNNDSIKKVIPPSPPVISSQKPNVPPPPMAPFVNTQNRLSDGIPLQINQRAKEIKEVKEVSEEVEKKDKKSKKKKKEKKKRKKSKKKHRHSSSSSSSSSEESSVSSPERKSTSTDKMADSTTSIRVQMRNAVNAPPRAHLKPKSDDEEPRDAGGWTVVQAEPRAIPPKPPTISANGEAQNRKDEAMINQWAPVPVISDKEKQLFEQLKGKIKHRDEKKIEVTAPQPVQPAQPVVPPPPPPSSSKRDEPNDKSNKANDKRRDESDKEFKDLKEKDRRDTYRKRRSRSPSTPRRDRRSRSPRRDRRRRSRSPSPRRDRRYSRSPRRDRRRDRYSRSRSPKDRRTEKDNKLDKNKTADKTKKPPVSGSSGKKLPFIGRMPVFKKQTTDDDTKKQEPINDVSEEEKLIQKKKQDELKFQIHQKQQMLQLQQKQAEAYNLAHPGQFANIYSTHGTIHHILPAVQPEEYDLMPDPMQYAMMTGPAPPMPMQMQMPMAMPVPVPEPEPQKHYEETNEPVLPPGIDEEEVNMELDAVPPPPPPQLRNKDNLPKDFQDALSIIFDGAATESSASVAATPAATDQTDEITNVVMQDDSSNFAQMDIESQHAHEQNGAANMELDEQSQYMMYSEEHYVQNHMQQAVEQPTADLSTQNIPTPPIQILDAAGNLTQIPGQVLEVGSDFVVCDPDGNPLDTTKYGAEHNSITAKNDDGLKESEHDIELQDKRRQELDDLAMLGIDADDLAAQCI